MSVIAGHVPAIQCGIRIELDTPDKPGNDMDEVEVILFSPWPGIAKGLMNGKAAHQIAIGIATQKRAQVFGICAHLFIAGLGNLVLGVRALFRQRFPPLLFAWV